VDAPIGNAISLSDGVMNLTLLHFPEGTKGGKGGPVKSRRLPDQSCRDLAIVMDDLGLRMTSDSQCAAAP
jgi:hypothetical protein